MKKIIPTLALILATSIANAEPIYLECNVKDWANFSVSLNEASGKVSQTYVNEPTHSFQVEGIYSPNSISYSHASTPTMIHTYIIDRANLSIQDSTRMTFQGETLLHSGQCSKVEEVKGNKI